MQLNFDYTTHMQCHYMNMRLLLELSHLKGGSQIEDTCIELVHSPEQGKNPLDFPKPQQKTQMRIFAEFSRIKCLF